MSNWSLCTFASLGKETLTKTGRLTLKNFFMGFLTWWGTMMKKVTILHINLMIQWRPQQKNCLLSLTKMVMGIDQRYISHINNVFWMIYSIIYLYWNFLSQILVRCRTSTCYREHATIHQNVMEHMLLWCFCWSQHWWMLEVCKGNCFYGFGWSVLGVLVVKVN